jgi:hypothetical protein
LIPDTKPSILSYQKHNAIGKTGIGGVKRPPSPSVLERATKIAKQSEALSADEFRERARKEYEDRRAEGRLKHTRATCVSLDTKADIEVCVKVLLGFTPCSRLTFPSTQFNRFWLDPENPESFPPGLLEALNELWSSQSSVVPDPGPSDIEKLCQGGPDAGKAARLKAQMEADALQPLKSSSGGGEVDEDDERPLRVGTGVSSDRDDHVETVAVWPEETLLQVGDYLRLSVSNSLHFPLFSHQS